MTLAESLPKEMERIIILREDYRGLPNGSGTFGASMMTIAIDRAQKSLADGDTIQMIRAHHALTEITG